MKFERIRRHFKRKAEHIVGRLITHEHGGHTKYTRQFINNSVINHMTAGTQQAIGFESRRLCTIRAKQELRIGTWPILPFNIEYDANEPVAFLLQSTLDYKILYAIDTRYLKYKFNDITHIMLGVNYIYEQMQGNIKNGGVHNALTNRIMESHFSLERTIGMLKASDLTRLEEIHLVHLSSQNSNVKYIKSEVQKMTDAPVRAGGL